MKYPWLAVVVAALGCTGSPPAGDLPDAGAGGDLPYEGVAFPNRRAPLSIPGGGLGLVVNAKADTVTAVDGTQSVDDLTVNAPVAAGPMGLPIQTITATGGIQVGVAGQKYAGTYPRASRWVQMLVLEDGTAAPTEEESLMKMSGIPSPKAGVLAFEPGQGGKLYKAVKATSTSVPLPSPCRFREWPSSLFWRCWR